MPFRSRNIARETAAAIAVIAIYLLVLLAPLHQAAGLQRDLDQLGFTSLDTWSICAALAEQIDEDEQPLPVKCAVSGIGKNELAAIEPVALDIGILPVAVAVRFSQSHLLDPTGPQPSSGQPRAPPLT